MIQMKTKKIDLVLKCSIILALATLCGCTVIDLITAPEMTWPQIMMGNEGEYCYFYAKCPDADLDRIFGAIARCDKEPYRLAVDSPSPEITATLILRLVENTPHQCLTKLKITYIGSEEYKETVRKAVEARGAKFYFYKVHQ